ncbi:MAG: hypothetical protein Edafosvirus6_33 [Edafosvirus sp.]|uniref:Uncharacterized protein n=1 Tax=Edafosvirus sp. TaxID=2487765 RepID=A0A3G4ZV25_9VIRU|nr:MAG: hypothetical protein Edafosvirus6_33 [Edafosvirus sp.]
MDIIRLLFTLIFNIGIYVQKSTQKGVKIDGKKIWGNIEKIICALPTDITCDKYSAGTLTAFHNEIISLDNKYKLTKNEFSDMANHFLLQLYNLPIKKSDGKIILFRLMQIAFNAGQLFVLHKMKKLNPEIDVMLSKFKYIDLSFYVNDEQKIKLASYISTTDFIWVYIKIMCLTGNVMKWLKMIIIVCFIIYMVYF